MTSDCAAPRRLRLPAERRVRRKADFQAASASGRRLGNGYFGLTVRNNGLGAPRLGLAVAVRVAGNGVERNRLRRIVRESFRLQQHQLPGVDLIVSARDRARHADSAALRAALQALWRKVTEQCASPSS